MVVSSPEDRRRWFVEGRRKGKTHMLIVTDTFSYENYPVYVPCDLGEAGETADPQAVYDHYHGENMQRVMEVFDLRDGDESKIDAPTYLHEGVEPRQLTDDLILHHKLEEEIERIGDMLRAAGRR